MTYLDRHIIICTPKEIVSFSLLGIFKLQLLKMIVFDDADYVVSTKLVQTLLVANCQKVFISTSHFKIGHEMFLMKLLVDSQSFFNIQHFYMKRANDEAKMESVEKICEEVRRNDSIGKAIIFCDIIYSLN